MTQRNNAATTTPNAAQTGAEKSPVSFRLRYCKRAGGFVAATTTPNFIQSVKIFFRLFPFRMAGGRAKQ